MDIFWCAYLINVILGIWNSFTQAYTETATQKSFIHAYIRTASLKYIQNSFIQAYIRTA